MTITEDNTCNCEYTTNPEGFQVCRWCGLFNEDYQEMQGTHWNTLITNDNADFKKEIYGSINHTDDGFGTLGTLLYCNGLDHRNRAIKNRIKNRFKRMMKYKYVEFHDKEKTNIRIINDGKIICKLLGLPTHVIAGSFLRFRKIVNHTHVNNKVVCLFYCIWEATRCFKYKIPLVDIIKIHQERGHRVSSRELNKTAGKYREVLKQQGIKVSLPLSNRDHIEIFSVLLRENHEIGNNNLIKWKINIESKLFTNEVIKLAFKMYDTLNDKGLIQGGNPKTIAVATIYAASVVYTKRYTNHIRKSVFTQIELENLLGISNEGFRKIYAKLYKPFIPK